MKVLDENSYISVARSDHDSQAFTDHPLPCIWIATFSEWGMFKNILSSMIVQDKRFQKTDSPPYIPLNQKAFFFSPMTRWYLRNQLADAQGNPKVPTPFPSQSKGTLTEWQALAFKKSNNKIKSESPRKTKGLSLWANFLRPPTFFPPSGRQKTKLLDRSIWAPEALKVVTSFKHQKKQGVRDFPLL